MTDPIEALNAALAYSKSIGKVGINAPSEIMRHLSNQGFTIAPIAPTPPVIDGMDVPKEVWLQLGFADGGGHTWCDHKTGEVEHEVGPYLLQPVSPIAPSDEKVRAAIKELNMAAGIADTFHGRNCCAALDTLEAALAEPQQKPEPEVCETCGGDGDIVRPYWKQENFSEKCKTCGGTGKKEGVK